MFQEKKLNKSKSACQVIKCLGQYVVQYYLYFYYSFKLFYSFYLVNTLLCIVFMYTLHLNYFIIFIMLHKLSCFFILWNNVTQIIN